MTQAITTQDVSRAATELDSMRRSLARWLKYRTLNDQVLAGTADEVVQVVAGQPRRLR